ncbi:MAG: amidohydrolase family protein [Variovorax sp.]|nr:amidohydrolase family protein [Variovorax sp.]
MPATRRNHSQSPAEMPYSAGTHRPGIAVPGDACDCHLHVYDSDFPAAPAAWLRPPDASISDYRLLQQRLGTRRAVLVTPSTYGTDNRVMLNALQALGADGRGVAVIDGTESDEQLGALHAQGVRGIRLNLSLGVAGSVEMLEPLAQRIADLGWHLQLLMSPEALADLGDTLRRLPVRVVFDHFARISPGQSGAHPAHALVLALLREGRAWVKLSGGYLVSPRATTDDPALTDLARSYLEANPDRIVWGSDWPHATASAGIHPMPDDARQMDRLADWTADADLFRRVLVDNPTALYGFASPSHSD